MGIVAAQYRVFIAQNDICAPRPLYYHLFFIDNRCVPACSPTRRLPDSLLLPSIPTAFHVPYRLRLASLPACRVAKRPVSPTFSSSASVSVSPFGCLLCRSCGLPSRFLVRFPSILVVFAVGIEAGGTFRVVPDRVSNAVASLPVPFSCTLGAACRLPRRWAGREAGSFMGCFT